MTWEGNVGRRAWVFGALGWVVVAAGDRQESMYSLSTRGYRSRPARTCLEQTARCLRRRERGQLMSGESVLPVLLLLFG